MHYYILLNVNDVNMEPSGLEKDGNDEYILRSQGI